MLLSQCHGLEKGNDGVYKGLIGQMGSPLSEDKPKSRRLDGKLSPTLV
jgi:hypothetical protein